MKQAAETTMKDAALHYAKEGWPVFAVHSVGEDGRCDCGKADCSSPAKHPWPINGVKAATCDVAFLAELPQLHSPFQLF